MKKKCFQTDKGSAGTLPADLPAKNVQDVLQAEVRESLQAEAWRFKFTPGNDEL